MDREAPLKVVEVAIVRAKVRSNPTVEKEVKVNKVQEALEPNKEARVKVVSDLKEGSNNKESSLAKLLSSLN